MASYGISSVRDDAHREYVTEVKIHLYDGALYFSSRGWWKRNNVLRAFSIGDRFVTLRSAPGDQHRKVEDMHVVTVSGTHYFRVDNELAPADDLGRLPEE
ncbi:MAG TPA: hypothetical protein VJG32_19300 [Anaerolineae bacterium]|nr:hypothetical protein [Anaerolineae bacterium]